MQQTRSPRHLFAADARMQGTGLAVLVSPTGQDAPTVKAKSKEIITNTIAEGCGNSEERTLYNSVGHAMSADVENRDGAYCVTGTRISLDSIVYAFHQGASGGSPRLIFAAPRRLAWTTFPIRKRSWTRLSRGASWFLTICKRCPSTSGCSFWSTAVRVFS
jgi:hypothetical protein